MRLTPYCYPKSKHIRQQTPKSYKSYRTYRPFLRVEFKRKCVYCRKPDGLGATFGVDHYRPKEKFKLLRAEYSNLYYACNDCNSLKGEFWPSDEQSSKSIFIPNPCDHKMAAHLRFEEERVAPRTTAGRFTADLLRLNEAEAILFRQFVNRTITRAVRESIEMRSSLRKVSDLLKTEKSVPKKRRMEAAINKIEAELEIIRCELARLTGDADVALP